MALRRRIIKAAADGLTKSQIALKTGVSRQRIGQLCAALQLPVLKVSDQFERVADEVERMARDGAGSKAIALALKLPVEKVSRMRVQRGVPERDAVADRRKDVLRLAQAGLRPIDISEALGVSYFVVQSDRAVLGLMGDQSKMIEIAARRKRIYALYKQGKTLDHIARVVDVHYTTAHNETIVFRLDPELRALVEKRILEGRRNSAIHWETGCNYTEILSVANELRSRGLIDPRRGHRRLATPAIASVNSQS